MRRGLALVVALLSVVSAAQAAHRDVSVQATPADGPAPLTVTFTASEPVQWNFGDGTSASGTSVQHIYAAGRWLATWSSASGSGSVTIVAHGIDFRAPAHVKYRARATFRGQLVPAEGGVAVTITGNTATLHTTSHDDGSFLARTRLTHGGTWTASTAEAATDGTPVLVVPRLRTGLLGSGARGSRFVFAASVRPKDAGELEVKITRGGATVADRAFDGPVRIKLDTRRLATYTIRVRVGPNEGFTPVVHLLHAHIVLPRLAYGSRGAVVAQLGTRLRALHYATPFTAVFDSRLLDSVYAFEKVQGLARTGIVDPSFWRALANPRIPSPRYPNPSAHIEIDKTHQVLYIVRAGRIALIVPVSTAGLPGKFTPVGRFSIYRKVTGFDPSPLGTLYDPMYFTGGYAIHGNPSVPPYPASHGCVRVPMWLAAALYATNPYGETVYVY